MGNPRWIYRSEGMSDELLAYLRMWRQLCAPSHPYIVIGDGDPYWCQVPLDSDGNHVGPHGRWAGRPISVSRFPRKGLQ